MLTVHIEYNFVYMLKTNFRFLSKKFCLLIIVLVLSSTNTFLFAQLTKEEKIALKKELKQYKKMKPIEIKVLKEDADQSKLELREANTEIAVLRIKSDSLQNQLKQATIIAAELQVKLDEQAALASQTSTTAAPVIKGKTAVTTKQSVQATPAKPPSAVTVSGNVDKGVVFKVQLGAYRLFEIKDKLSTEEGVVQEVNDGLFKYVLGAYRDLSEAKVLRKEVIKMGIKDAWIVSYKDGQRVPLKDALAELKMQAKNEQKPINNDSANKSAKTDNSAL